MNVEPKGHSIDMSGVQFQKIIVDNIRGISIAVGGLIVVLVLLAGALELKSRNEAKAVDSLYKARKSITAIKDADIPAKVKELESVITEYPGTRAAYEALLSMGDLYMEAKNYPEGIAAYDRAVAAASEPFAKMLALYNKATAQEIADNCVDALKSYSIVLTEASAEFLKPEIMMAQARCEEKEGQVQAAIDKYQKIQEEFSDKAFYANSAAVFQKKLQKQLKN